MRSHLEVMYAVPLLRILLAEFKDRVGTAGQEVTPGVKDLGGIDERGDS